MRRKKRGQDKAFQKKILVRFYMLCGVFFIVLAASVGYQWWKNKHKVIIETHTNDYATMFNDVNKTQLAAAEKYGITPLKKRSDVENALDALEKIEDNDTYEIAPLDYSVPYLTHSAKDLLDSIAIHFQDSLTAKELPQYKIIVSSVLRTKEDIRKLQKVNANSTSKSAHQYATTFDIKYNAFASSSIISSAKKKVNNETLKQTLAEVLKDLKDQEKCYVKYEIKQPCFHITVRY